MRELLQLIDGQHKKIAISSSHRLRCVEDYSERELPAQFPRVSSYFHYVKAKGFHFGTGETWNRRYTVVIRNFDLEGIVAKHKHDPYLPEHPRCGHQTDQTPYRFHSRNHGLFAYISSCLKLAAQRSDN